MAERINVKFKADISNMHIFNVWDTVHLGLSLQEAKELKDVLEEKLKEQEEK